jgi:hypothetical protein
MALLRRFGVLVLAVVGFNSAMVVLGAIKQEPVDTAFVIVWIAGDFVVSLMALALSERS